MVNANNQACKFLESLHRYDLAMLLKNCEVATIETETDNGWYNELVTEAVVRAPTPLDQALTAMPLYDRKRVAEAITSISLNSKSPDDIRVESIGKVSVSDSAILLSELIIHREMMISVATGGDRIQDVNDYYQARQMRITTSIGDDIEYHNPHGDLWDWYNYWSAKLPQYKDRRLYVRKLFAAAIITVSRRTFSSLLPRQPTGWERVDRALSKARAQFETASAEEDFQGIGLLCREVIISLAQAVYDVKIHEAIDGITPSTTDANRMLEAFVVHDLPGSSNKEIRAHARASLALALNLQHRRTATRQLAALCLEATSSTTAVISIIARKISG